MEVELNVEENTLTNLATGEVYETSPLGEVTFGRYLQTS